MKKTAALFSLFLISFFSFGQNGLTCYTIPQTLLPTGTVVNSSQVALDTSGKFLFSTYGAGLIQFDGVNYTKYSTSNSGIKSNFINLVAVDTSSNNYYIATKSEGLSLFNGTSWTNYDSLNSNLICNRVSCIAPFNNGAFIGTNYGLSVFQNGVFTNFNHSNSGLGNDTIYTIIIDSTGNAWIGTKRGLFQFDGTSFTAVSSLSNSSIYSLCFAEKYLWIAAPNLLRLKNTTVEVLSDIFYGPALVSYAIPKLTIGPNGGVLFWIQNRFCEIVHDTQKFYPFLNVSPCTGFITAYALNKSGDKIIVKYYGKSFALFDFTQPSPFYNYWYNSSCYNNSRFLDINNVKAAITNRSSQFYVQGNHKYEIPKGSGKNTILANSIWIGGKDSLRQLHLAAQDYGDRYHGLDFWPGPLDSISGQTDTSTAMQYDRLWLINRYDIEQFKHYYQTGAVQNGNFIPAKDILEWPANGTGNYTRNMAPFVDVNQDGIYNPLAGGDYPLIKGDQMAYWIFNDNLEFHAASFGSQPMKIEIHASAYSYACPNILNRDSIINYTTFYNYKIFNRSNLNYDSCYIANWSDFDLGYEYDDGLASAPQNNFIYAYNFDSLDHNYSFPTNSYELNPPIISDVVLSGPLAYLNDTIDNDNDGLVDELGEKNLLTGSLSYHDDFALSMGNPSAPIHFYNFMQSRWRNGRQMTTQGWGDIGTIVTKYAFPNFPSDSGVWHCPLATDGSFIASSGPFLFPAGSSFDYDFAFVFSRDTTLTYNSAAYYQMAVSDVQRVKYWFDNNNAPSCLVFPGVPETQLYNNSILIFPNPANTLLNIQFRDQEIIQDLMVMDVMGKPVKQVSFNIQKKANIQLNILDLASGIYFVLVRSAEGKQSTAKFIKTHD